VLTLTIPGNPKPKERPRFVRGRVYSPSKGEERRMAQHIRFQLPLHYKPLKGILVVRATFFRKTKHRVDLDNLIKALDCCNGLVWADDSQIHHWIATIKYDSENPRTTLTVEEFTE